MKKNKNYVSIGGQAVIEGVMMRGKTAQALAVRDSNGIIRLETKKLKQTKAKKIISKIPLLRGVYSFIVSLFGGMQVLMRSAEVFGEDEPTKFEKWLSKKLKIDPFAIVGTFSLILSLVISVFLFIYLPQQIRVLLESLFGVEEFSILAKNLIEGFIKILIFVSYIVFTSLFKDIKRTFMYHGAEHKTISCFENGLKLTPENVKKCSRVHNRCGTTFIFFVMTVSIIVFACFESLIGYSVAGALRVAYKLLLLPLVAGLSYELLKGLAKTECFIFYPLKAPGLLLQRITTKEPDISMIEVAIASFNAVLEMDGDESIKERDFNSPIRICNITNAVINKLSENGIDQVSDSEWIVSICLNIKRDAVYSKEFVDFDKTDGIFKLVGERITGKPLWYCVGDTEFYGYKIKVDERVLIPRQETELLVENALKCVVGSSDVLDLCTGSGAIAIAVKKQSNANVFASDISFDALALAKENAKINDADITFIESDMFGGIDRKFDVIISNPPYIISNEIDSLQTEVKDFEPRLALDGGEDGFDFYRNICENAKNYLEKDGYLFLECGLGQAEIISKMLVDFKNVEIIKDYNNIDRIVKAQKNV